MDCATKDCVATEQASEEGIVVSLFAGGRGMAEEQHGGLVDKREETEVTSVLARGFVDQCAF